MIASRTNVLHAETVAEQSFGRSEDLFGRVERVPSADYREAVAQIVREIKAERQWDNEQLAEKLGCSKTTVANAENKRTNLDAVTMLNLGAIGGGQRRIARIIALINGRPDKPVTPAERIERANREIAIALSEMEGARQ